MVCLLRGAFLYVFFYCKLFLLLHKRVRVCIRACGNTWNMVTLFARTLVCYLLLLGLKHHFWRQNTHSPLTQAEKKAADAASETERQKQTVAVLTGRLESEAKSKQNIQQSYQSSQKARGLASSPPLFLNVTCRLWKTCAASRMKSFVSWRSDPTLSFWP